MLTRRAYTHTHIEGNTHSPQYAWVKLVHVLV
jgi:hypothetical protein